MNNSQTTNDKVIYPLDEDDRQVCGLTSED